MPRKATTRSQVQAKKKAAAKKAAPKKPVRGQRAATSAANQKKAATKKAPAKKATAKRNVGKTVRAAERQARAAIGDKAFNMQERVADRNVKTLKSKPAPTTPPKKGAAKGAVTRKQNQFKKAAGAAAKAARKGAKSDAVRPTQRAQSSVKPAATATARKAQVAKLLKQGMKRAGIIGLGFAAADFAGLTPKLTDRDARMGRRTQEVQKKEKAITPKDKGLKKKANPPRKKPVNIGNVSKAKADAAARKKEREDAMAERLAAKRAERKAAQAKKKVPANVVRDGSGNPIRTKNGGYLTSGGFDENKNFWE
jgi:hypothetical protein